MSASLEEYVISIMSRDRVGIIYEVSQAIRELNGNIADVRQSVMCGYFTMILLASFPEGVTQRAIERKLAEVDARSETAIDSAVKRVEGSMPPAPAAVPENAYVLTATGPDRVGFVATVASFCAGHGINILDLSTTAAEGNYIMILVIDVSGSGPIREVRQDLACFAEENGFRVVLQHYDIFRAINEINMPAR